MRHDFLDQHTHLDSCLHRLDPRAKLVAVCLAVLVVAATPAHLPRLFGGYYALIAVLALLSRVPLPHLARRCMAAAPFIVMAASLPLISAWLGPGPNADAGAPGLLGYAPPEARDLSLAVLMKGFAAILLLTLLTATTRFHHLLWGLHRLRAPEVLSVVAGLAYRYLFVLLDEWGRTQRARACRSPAGLRMNRFSLYAKQIGLVFVRGWERAERVHNAMMLRGFQGRMPVTPVRQFSLADGLFVAIAVGSFLAVRLAAL
jgi:cobalt/nickel transport system permease protein